MNVLFPALRDTLHLPLTWHLCGIGFVTLLIAARQLSGRNSLFMIFAWSFLSTLAHECCHYLAGKLCRATVHGFTLLPRREGNRLVLGSVTFRNLNPFTAPLVALAPLSLLPVACLLFINWTTLITPSPAATIGLYTSMYLLAYGSIPSTADLKIALNWKSVLLYGLMGYLGYAAWQFMAR